MGDLLELDRVMARRESEWEERCAAPDCPHYVDVRWNECCGRVWCYEDISNHQQEAGCQVDEDHE